MYAIVDCNNFYVSCERVFEPRLAARPVVVLSNNDGCVISRSQEAKNLGIPMGEPFFKCRSIIDRNGVVVRSSNYCLYDDMSRRVIQSVLEFVPDLEIYSIDEAFLDLQPLARRDHEHHCRQMRAAVLAWTGIPVSVGIAPTKTLAKLANRIAKREPSSGGVYQLPPIGLHRDLAMDSIEVGDIWGIGRRWGRRLLRMGIRTAFDLAKIPPAEIHSSLNVVAMRTAMELRGRPCQALEDVRSPRKTLVRSRSFGEMVTTWQELSEAIATHAARAAEMLRSEDATAGQVSVFLQTNQFRKDLPQRHCSGSRELLSHTSSTRIILSEAIAIGQNLWRDGFHYKKAGVMLSDICHDHPQRSLFEPRDLNRDWKLMRTMDAINARMGERSLHPASMGLRRRNWHMRRKQQSPRYTTRWDELPQVIADIRGMRPRH